MLVAQILFHCSPLLVCVCVCVCALLCAGQSLVSTGVLQAAGKYHFYLDSQIQKITPPPNKTTAIEAGSMQWTAGAGRVRFLCGCV